MKPWQIIVVVVGLVIGIPLIILAIIGVIVAVNLDPRGFVHHIHRKLCNVLYVSVMLVAFQICNPHVS